ncbi:histone H4, partial [Massarina eburnea CBS 473.64]
YRKVQRDNILGITKGDLRRLARRGGIKRISAGIYDDMRYVLKQRLELLLKQIVALVEHGGRKTVTVTDVIFTLNRLGRPLYGFDASFDGRTR